MTFTRHFHLRYTLLPSTDEYFTFWTITCVNDIKNIFHSVHSFNMLQRSQNVCRKKLKWFSVFSSASPLTKFQIANDWDKIFQDLLSSWAKCLIFIVPMTLSLVTVHHCFHSIKLYISRLWNEKIENSLWKLCHRTKVSCRKIEISANSNLTEEEWWEIEITEKVYLAIIHDLVVCNSKPNNDDTGIEV